MQIQRRRWTLTCCVSAMAGLTGWAKAARGATAHASAGSTEPAAAPPSAQALRLAMTRALMMRDQARRAGDQAYGAAVLCDERVVGEAPSRVVTRRDPDAHAEREALRDAQRRLGRADLSGCVLVSSSRPCRLCEDAAAQARIARMIHGETLLDAGPPGTR